MNAMETPGPLTIVDGPPREPEVFELLKCHHAVLRYRQPPDRM